MDKDLFALFVLATWVAMATASDENHAECFDCYDMPSTCNDTHCYPILPCRKVCHVIGSCLMMKETNLDSMEIIMHAMCMPEAGNFAYLQQTHPFSDKLCDARSLEQPVDGATNKTTISCQCLGDYCNEALLVYKEEQPAGPENHLLIIIGGTAGLLLVIVIVSLWQCIRVRQRNHDDEKAVLQEFNKGQNRLSSDGSSLLDGQWEESGRNSCSTYKYSTSMSLGYSRNSKANALNQNNQHLPIELQEVIGRGQFAEVWKAQLSQSTDHSETVSVKVFRLQNYGAWRQEKDILTQSWMRHENIIEYFTSEQHNKHNRSRPQFWLITAYYNRGNLQMFLRNNTLLWPVFINMALSIANGLTFLHAERDENGRHKLPIAHRDMKSCNILVKDDGRSCVLADLGLSLKLDPALTRDELANAGQVGTSRYMAPELLERLVNLVDIESFKRVDVYAMALVMWELASRCTIIDPVHEYQPPFGSHISDHPNKEQMLVLVCRQKQRPDIPQHWRSSQKMESFLDSVVECWVGDPDCRITASCFHERLTSLKNTSVIANDAEIQRKQPASPPSIIPLKNDIVNEVSEISELINATVA